MTSPEASSGAIDLGAVAKRYAIAPLYHAVLERVPERLGTSLHHISPDDLHAHLSYLKSQFRFLSVDEFVAAQDRTGLACLSFDDGHKSVVEAALPVLVALDIPATVFINSAGFERPHLWRDKIRWLIEHDRVGEFERFMVDTRAVPGRSFYRYSKDPANSSIRVEREVDRFLSDRGIELNGTSCCFDDPSWLVRHELLSYGNHTHSHYVLSSLTANQQYEEIQSTRAFLQRQPGIRLSNVFAVPFGGSRDFDGDTVAIVAQMGYEGILLSRGRLNAGSIRTRGLALVERFMPRGPRIEDSVAKALRDSGS